MIKIRKYLKDPTRWQVDIRVRFPDGTTHRERRLATSTQKSEAKREAEKRQAVILAAGPPSKVKAKVPTVEGYWPTYKAHLTSQRRKPSHVESVGYVFTGHLIPLLGDLPLDEAGTTDAQAKIKIALAKRAPKTVNNVLTTLGGMLTHAHLAGLLDKPPTIKRLPAARKAMQFHEFSTYARLVAAARAHSPEAYLAILLGGDAGLRRGEALALRRENARGAVLTVCESLWRGHTTAPKSGRARYVPPTTRLRVALDAIDDDGGPILAMDARTLKKTIKEVEEAAGLPVTGRFHIYRHTFCSHLAMRGAPVRVIQELAGHADLAVTQRYMHLAPGNTASAIALLEPPEDPTPESPPEPTRATPPEPEPARSMRGNVGATPVAIAANPQ